MTLPPTDSQRLRQRLLDQLDQEDDPAALLVAELSLIALREPLEPGPVAVLLRHLADQLEVALERQDAELTRLRRQLHQQAQELARLRGQRVE